MKDCHIRTALKSKLLSRYAKDPSTLIVDELGLRHGAARIDVAVINGVIHGFELKSDCDTLNRLPSQVKIYNSVLDRITLVVGNRHLEKGISLVPDWWGIKLAEPCARGAIRFTEIRRPQGNPFQDIIAVCKLLWREEALTLLEELDRAEGVRRKPRAMIYAKLAEAGDPDLIRSRVRHQLRSRTHWRSATEQVSSGG
jgi:hypothetical protein